MCCKVMVLSAPHKSKILPRFAKKTARHACGAPAACGARPRRAPRSKPPTTGRVRKRLPHARDSPSRTCDAAPCAVAVAVPHRPRGPMRRVPAAARAARGGRINGSWQDFQLMRAQVENLVAFGGVERRLRRDPRALLGKTQVRNYMLKSHRLGRAAQVENLVTPKGYSGLARAAIRKKPCKTAGQKNMTPSIMFPCCRTSRKSCHDSRNFRSSRSGCVRSRRVRTANGRRSARSSAADRRAPAGAAGARLGPGRANPAPTAARGWRARPLRTPRTRRGFRPCAGRPAGALRGGRAEGATSAGRGGAAGIPASTLRRRLSAGCGFARAAAPRPPSPPRPGVGRLWAPRRARGRPLPTASGVGRGRASARSGFVAIFFDSLTSCGAPRRPGEEAVSENRRSEHR